MRTLAMFIDDAGTVRQVLQQQLDQQRRCRVILVACPPRLTHHASRFLTSACRAQFRQRWSRNLFAQLQPLWAAAPAGTVETIVANARPDEMLRRLREVHGPALQVVDARRARLDIGGEDGRRLGDPLDDTAAPGGEAVSGLPVRRFVG